MKIIKESITIPEMVKFLNERITKEDGKPFVRQDIAYFAKKGRFPEKYGDYAIRKHGTWNSKNRVYNLIKM